MSKIIIYIKNKKKQPRAIMMAVQTDENNVSVGYALCNKKDTFTKEKGKQIAELRAKAFIEKVPKNVPQTVAQAMPDFITRCKKYFADKQFPAWTNL